MRGELVGAVGCEKNRNALGPNEGKIKGCPVQIAAVLMMPIATAPLAKAKTDPAS
ncbi:unnamed protein product, partial [marine sediment metagenome]